MGGFFVAPGCAAERAMVGAGVILVAGELADLAEGGVMEVVAVTIEAIFGEVLVIFDAVFGAEFFCFGPGFGLDFEEFDVGAIIGLT